MTQKLESKEEATRRVRREFDSYSASVLLSEPEGAAVSGDSPYTWKAWRLSRSGKGPEATYLNGQVRYTVGAIRSWLERSASAANQKHHAPKQPAVTSAFRRRQRNLTSSLSARRRSLNGNELANARSRDEHSKRQKPPG